MGGVAAILVWLIIFVGFGVVVWLVATRSRRSPQSNFIGPTASSAPQWTMCEKCGGGNYPQATYCQWCAAPLSATRAILTPEPTPLTAGAATLNAPNPLPTVAPPDPGPATAVTQVDPGAPATSVADEIAKLADLRASDQLTDEEFAAFKAKLME
jgi:hypothetical protein